MARLDTESLEKEYLAKRPSAEASAVSLAERLTKLLSDEAIALSVPVHTRVKSWASLVEKLSRRSIDPKGIGNIKDLVGARVVVQFQRDLPLVCDLVARNFWVVESEDTTKRLQPDQFGYASTHFHVRMFDRADEPQPHDDMLLEIQVRTTAQHIWATASHQLQYKTEHDVPPEQRRALSRISAFLEAADQEFDRLLASRDEYERRQLKRSAKLPLDVDLLRVVLDKLLPRANKAAQDDYAALLGELSTHGIATVGDLQQLVKAQLSAALRFDADLVKRERERLAKARHTIPILDAPVTLRLEKGAFSTHTGLVRVMIAFQFVPLYKKRKHRRAL